jgi:hypothetical protein
LAKEQREVGGRREEREREREERRERGGASAPSLGHDHKRPLVSGAQTQTTQTQPPSQPGEHKSTKTDEPETRAGVSFETASFSPPSLSLALNARAPRHTLPWPCRDHRPSTVNAHSTLPPFKPRELPAYRRRAREREPLVMMGSRVRCVSSRPRRRRALTPTRRGADLARSLPSSSSFWITHTRMADHGTL